MIILLFSESVRDLIRYLRNDDRAHTARRLCGERNIVENDLVPLMKSTKDENMFDACLRLVSLVGFLTATLIRL